MLDSQTWVVCVFLHIQNIGFIIKIDVVTLVLFFHLWEKSQIPQAKAQISQTSSPVKLQ